MLQEHTWHILLTALPAGLLILIVLVRRLSSVKRKYVFFQTLILLSTIPHLSPHIELVSIGHEKMALCCILAQASSPETQSTLVTDRFVVLTLPPTPTRALQPIILDTPRIRSPPYDRASFKAYYA